MIHLSEGVLLAAGFFGILNGLGGGMRHRASSFSLKHYLRVMPASDFQSVDCVYVDF